MKTFVILAVALCLVAVVWEVNARGLRQTRSSDSMSSASEGSSSSASGAGMSSSEDNSMSDDASNSTSSVDSSNSDDSSDDGSTRSAMVAPGPAVVEPVVQTTAAAVAPTAIIDDKDALVPGDNPNADPPAGRR